MNYLAQIGSGLPGNVGADFQVTLGGIISTFVRYALLIGGFFVAYQLFNGALQWVLSGGDKEKLTKARQMMTNSLIGLIILFSVWTIFLLITGDILGIFRRSADGGIRFELPYLFDQGANNSGLPTPTPIPAATPTHIPTPTPTPSGGHGELL